VGGLRKLRVIAESDDESGEMKIYLFCSHCREREVLHVC
jgi:hypothetical protein